MKKIFLILATCTSLGAQSNGDGAIALPKDYREWVFLSAGLGMTYGPAASADRGNPKFENVFVNPASYRAFVATGKWPDKTMFILEIRRASEKGSINNAGHFQTDVVDIEAEMKDESRAPQKWVFFAFGQTAQGKPFPATSSCNACHSMNAAVDNTFVQFYPTLLEIATQKGTLNAAWVKSSTR